MLKMLMVNGETIGRRGALKDGQRNKAIGETNNGMNSGIRESLPFLRRKMMMEMN